MCTITFIFLSLLLQAIDIHAIFHLPFDLPDESVAPVPVPRNRIALEHWARTELRFVQTLRDFLQANPHFLHDEPVLEEYWQDLTSSFDHLRGYDPEASLDERVSVVTGNPLAVLRMVYRLVLILWDVVENFPHGYIEEMELDLNDVFPNPWLGPKDLEDAVFGLLRIAFVYNYSAPQVAEGFLGDVDAGVKLSSAHCYIIAFYALNGHHMQFFDSAVEWSRLTLRKRKEDHGRLSEWMGVTLFKTAVAKHDREFKLADPLFPHLYTSQLMASETRPEDSRECSENDTDTCPRSQKEAVDDWVDAQLRSSVPALFRRVDATRRRRDVLDGQRYAGKHIHKDIYNYMDVAAMCSNGDRQTVAEKSKLFCWNEFLMDPYWLIGPLKMAFLSRNPDVVQMYQVIGPRLTEQLHFWIRYDLPMLSLDPEFFNGVVASRLRAQIVEEDFPVFRFLPRAVEAMTGLRVRLKTASEPFRLASYTSGGTYNAHVDNYVPGFEKNGFRLATLMYYLDEPELGGSTAFLRMKVRPVRGSDILWYNLLGSGEPDYDTYHAGCPVILGRKSVAFKFMRHYDQFLVRQCGLSPEGRFRVAVNGKEY